MKLNIAAALKAPGNKFTAEITQTMESFEYLGRELVFMEPLAIELSYSYNDSEINVNGKLKTLFLSTCSRCNEEYDEPFILDFNERFSRISSENDDVYLFTGDELLLDQMVRDCIILNLSPFGVCSEDCKGLCPVCGCNLNKSQCQCKRVSSPNKENPFLKLGELFNDGKEV